MPGQRAVEGQAFEIVTVIATGPTDAACSKPARSAAKTRHLAAHERAHRAHLRGEPLAFERLAKRLDRRAEPLLAQGIETDLRAHRHRVPLRARARCSRLSAAPPR
jgi:hypothetical protein